MHCPRVILSGDAVTHSQDVAQHLKVCANDTVLKHIMSPSLWDSQNCKYHTCACMHHMMPTHMQVMTLLMNTIPVGCVCLQGIKSNQATLEAN